MSSDASEPNEGADDVEPTTGADPAEDDVQQRFLDALKAKQEQSKDKANSGNRGEAKVHEVHRSTKQKRQFRRKSG